MLHVLVYVSERGLVASSEKTRVWKFLLIKYVGDHSLAGDTQSECCTYVLSVL
jgi:hypothetical protein